MAVESSQWEYVTFKAKISKTSDKVLYQVITGSFSFLWRMNLASLVVQVSWKPGEFSSLILKLSAMELIVFELYYNKRHNFDNF